MTMDQSGTRGRDFCLYKLLFPGSGSTCSLSTAGWRLPLSSWSWSTVDVSPGQSRLEQVEQMGTGLSRAELSSWRGPHPRVFPQPGCFIIKLFALNKLSFFTVPHVRDSYWHWLGTSDYLLTFWDGGPFGMGQYCSHEMGIEARFSHKGKCR